MLLHASHLSGVDDPKTDLTFLLRDSPDWYSEEDRKAKDGVISACIPTFLCLFSLSLPSLSLSFLSVSFVVCFGIGRPFGFLC